MRAHDVYLPPQYFPGTESLVVTFEVHEIDGKLACYACNEVWPCTAVLREEEQ